MKYLYFLLSITFSLFAQDPSPYKIEPLPPLNHGFFANGGQLALLIKEKRIQTVVEVGSWLGSSTLFIARRLPKEGKIYAVDHWEGSVEHKVTPQFQKLLPTLYEQFLSNVIHAGLTDKVVPIKMASLDAAEYLQIRPDLVYIDGDHSETSVYADLSAWYPKLADQGILCGDDWVWDGVRKAVLQFASERDMRIIHTGNFWYLIPKGQRTTLLNSPLAHQLSRIIFKLTRHTQ